MQFQNDWLIMDDTKNKEIWAHAHEGRFAEIRVYYDVHDSLVDKAQLESAQAIMFDSLLREDPKLAQEMARLTPTILWSDTSVVSTAYGMEQEIVRKDSIPGANAVTARYHLVVGRRSLKITALFPEEDVDYYLVTIREVVASIIM